MQLQNQFHVDAAPDDVLASLTDVASVASCFPGAQLTEVVDANTYAGEVKVRLGPVSVTFAGRMELIERDADARRAVFRATASDRKGRGDLHATIHMQVLPVANGSDVHVDSDVQLAGTVAQYGRGVGMVKRLANRNVEQFAAALAEHLHASNHKSTDSRP